jgi:hypothetical protein
MCLKAAGLCKPDYYGIRRYEGWECSRRYRHLRWMAELISPSWDFLRSCLAHNQPSEHISKLCLSHKVPRLHLCESTIIHHSDRLQVQLIRGVRSVWIPAKESPTHRTLPWPISSTPTKPHIRHLIPTHCPEQYPNNL